MRHPTMALLLGLALPSFAAAQQPATQTASSPRAAERTAAEKIANATSAAPASVASAATVLDWPASAGAAPAVLRPGTNGWACYPDFPGTEGNDPMCLDETWQRWTEAFLKKAPPRITRVGIAYMMGHGGGTGSNTDPFATGPTPDNEWGHDGPHLMVVVPDVAALQGLPTKRTDGGPWVMWRGTPYAHIMVPVTGRPH